MPAFMLPERSQRILLTEVDLDIVAPPGSAVRIIDELVESLDTSKIEAHYDVASDVGRPPFHPKTLVKVALLALHNCRFSLRKMEQDTTNHLAYRWLTGEEVVDHSTMGYFLARFGVEILELFCQVVKICQERGLIEFDLLAIDSVKLRANASYRQSKTLEGLEKEEEELKARLEGILDTVSDPHGAEAEERRTLERRVDRVKEAKQILHDRVQEKAREASEKQKQQLREKEKVNITDPDAHVMQQANGEKNPAYSITTTTDVMNDIVTHIQVNVQHNDAAVLWPAVEGSRETTGEKHSEVEADAGFASMENYERLEAEGQQALIPDSHMEVEEQDATARGEYDRSKFHYRERSDSYRCPAGEILRKTGTVEVHGRLRDRYENPRACVGCPHHTRCARGSHRRVFRDQNEEVRERMRAKLHGKRAHQRYNKRAHAAESPYGNVKWNLKFRAVMRRGREKVLMEVALLFMLHNILKLGVGHAYG
jgi:transposase